MKSTLFPRIDALNGSILITGHTGFKGTWLTLMLQHLGFNVIGVSLEPEETSLFSRMNRKGRIEEIFADIQDYDKVLNFLQIHRPSVVFHFAAQSLVAESYRNPFKTFSTNIMGSASILEACQNVESIRIVLVATTDKVYENNDSRRKFKESDSLGAKDPYSASKVGTEMAVKAWRSLKPTTNQPKIIVARAGNVIGGGDYAQNRIFPDLIRAFQNCEPMEIRNPKSTRPWQHVLDPLNGYLKFVERVLSGLEVDTLNFGPDGDDLTVSQLLDLAKDDFPGQLLEESNTKSSFSEANSLSLDSAFAKSELNWWPKYTQEEAINATGKWWRSYLAGEQTAEELCLNEIRQFFAGERNDSGK